MAAHRKPRKLVPLAAVLFVLVTAAASGYALAGNRATDLADSHVQETVNLGRTSGAPGQRVTVTACLASGKLSRISVAALKCPAKSAPFHWAAQSGPAGAPGQRVTVTACLASGKLSRISVAALKCPAKSVTIRWAGQSGPASSPSPLPRPSSSSSPSPGSPPSTVPSASSSPSTTSPSPVQTTASSSPTQTSTSPASWAWCSSAPLGQWTTPDGRFDLYNNEWNTSGNPGPQTICGNSESDWQAVSNQRAGNTEVLTAPSVQIPYNNSNGYPLSDFGSLSSSYAEDMHAVAGTDAEAMYDIWLNGLNKEVMFWVDDHGQTPSGSVVATTTFSGATWDLWQTGGGYWAFVRKGNASSGTVDLLAGLKYLESRGDLAATDKLWQVNFGWEICSTAGAPETFTVSNYSVDSTPNS
jgi:glycosyl hydrolase family 12